jgi:hypothetical protein
MQMYMCRVKRQAYIKHRRLQITIDQIRHSELSAVEPIPLDAYNRGAHALTYKQELDLSKLAEKG